MKKKNKKINVPVIYPKENAAIQYNYLRFMITTDAKWDSKIMKHLAISNNIFNSMSPILKKKHFSENKNENVEILCMTTTVWL